MSGKKSPLAVKRILLEYRDDSTLWVSYEMESGATTRPMYVATHFRPGDKLEMKYGADPVDNPGAVSLREALA